MTKPLPLTGRIAGRFWRRAGGVVDGGPFVLRTVAILILASASAIGAEGTVLAPAAADLEFFEKQIRPLLAQHCYECHGVKKSKGGLRLDVAAGWQRGGDSGPAVVAGKPDESLLIAAVRREGLEMPPTGKLPDQAIRALEEWVVRGAPAPADAGKPIPAKVSRTIDIEAGRQFWAYQPPHATAPPQVDDPVWSVHPMDRFIFSKLQEAGLRPQTPAERATLVRRLYFDLWGLPPDVDDLIAVESDQSPDWYERLVDRLLASPRFGERWARHWLDVVRFGESLTLRGFILPDAWRYRNYVIESFNGDRPYVQFLREQVAGDLLPADTIADRQRQLVATTFLALGNTNLEEQDKRQLDMDVVDEQLDVIGKAFLGQTIGCARCHDHKFDPIPTRDYYALAGILRNVQTLAHENVSKWMSVNLPLAHEDEGKFAEFEAQVAAVETKVAKLKEQLARADGQKADDAKVAAAADLPGIVIDDSQAKLVGAWQTSQSVKPYIGAGYVHDSDQGKGEKTATFAPELPKNGRYEVRLAYTAADNRAKDVPVTVFSAEGDRLIRVNMRERPPIDGRFISLGQYRCEAAGQNFVLVANEGTTGHVVVDAVQYLSADDDKPAARREELAQRIAPSQDEIKPDVNLVRRRGELIKLEKDLKHLRSTGPNRPQVMTVIERAKIEDAPLHIRGTVHSLGEIVPRGFLQVVAPQAVTPLPADQSGRRELADWIASPANPLTARVFANRAWHWLFGQGLVRTVDNFGTTGELPSHPELLDHLALYFATHDSSIKQLVRYLVTSRAYRQRSEEVEATRAADPENRRLARQNRQRLEAECLRDAMLAVSGQLRCVYADSTIRSDAKTDYEYVDHDTLRSIYVPVLRNSLPELFEAFDGADSSMVTGRRNTSTVVQQALFMMNSPFVKEQAMAAARRLLALDLADDDTRCEHAFRQTLGRAPRMAECEVVRKLLSETLATSNDRELAWADVYHMLFSSLDFRYRD
ncbi:MAG TPA: DUF1553 domain-containing protein [Pirellulales bacterium]